MEVDSTRLSEQGARASRAMERSKRSLEQQLALQQSCGGGGDSAELKRALVASLLAARWAQGGIRAETRRLKNPKPLRPAPRDDLWLWNSATAQMQLVMGYRLH